MNKVLTAALAAAALLALALPREARADTNEEKRDKKLAEGWVTKAPWITDYDRAREEARKSGKPIFAYFTRSYAP